MDKKQVSGALVVAAGLVIGGLVTEFAEHLNLRTAGLLTRRPSAEEVQQAAERVTDSVDPGLHGVPGKSGNSRQDDPSDAGGGRSQPAAPDKSKLGPKPLSLQRAQRLAPVEINSATAEDLELVDGIGPALAARIIEARTKKGGTFRSMDELLEVKGIGPATLARIKASAVLVFREAESQNTLRTSTSSQEDSSAFQR